MVGRPTLLRQSGPLAQALSYGLRCQVPECPRAMGTSFLTSSAAAVVEGSGSPSHRAPVLSLKPVCSSHAVVLREERGRPSLPWCYLFLGVRPSPRRPHLITTSPGDVCLSAGCSRYGGPGRASKASTRLCFFGPTLSPPSSGHPTIAWSPSACASHPEHHCLASCDLPSSCWASCHQATRAAKLRLRHLPPA